MYSKHYFVFFDKTNDFTIDEFGNIGRTMEDGSFNSNEIGRHVDTETIFMVRANAEKLINAWEGLDVYYIGDNVIHLHGQPLGYVSITTPTTAWRNTINRNAWVQTIKDYIWGIYNRIWAPSWKDCRNNLDIIQRPTGVCTEGDQWCKCCGGCWRECWDKKRKKCQANGSITSNYNRACSKSTAWGGDCDSYWGAWLNEVSNCCYSTMNKVKNDFWYQYPSKIDWLYYLY